MKVAATSLVSVAGVSSSPMAIRSAVRTIAVASGNDTAASTTTCSQVPTSGPCGANRSKAAKPVSAPPRRTASGCGMSVRRKILVPLAEHLEGLPEGLLRVGLVERGVDVGRGQQLHGGREALELPGPVFDRLRQWEAERVDELHRLGPH